MFALKMFLSLEGMAVHRPPGQCFEGRRTDELMSGFCHDHGHLRPQLHKATAEVCGFVSRNSPGDAQQNFTIGLTGR